MVQTSSVIVSDLRPRHLPRPKRPTKIPSNIALSPALSGAPSPTTALPCSNNNSSSSASSSVVLGTLMVSLPSGQLLQIQENGHAIDSSKLGDHLHVGENLLRKLDGKGAQLLTLQAFGGSTRARMFARLRLGQQTRPCSFLCEFVADPNNAANRIATIRVSGVQLAMKPEPNCDEFITRHNSGCSFIYFDAASVPYLAHFPSEKTGSSLFSIVHADDVGQVEEVHRELRAGVKLARTAGIRFVAHDGRVWRVNSEWAAFTNPWTMHVEMVVAKHRVVEMIGELTGDHKALPSEEQCRHYDSSIRSILENPPQFVESTEKLMLAADSRMPGSVSPPLTSEEAAPVHDPSAQSPDLLLSYTQINCLENVHRLLKSQTTNGADMSKNADSAANADTLATSPAAATPLTRELLSQHDRHCQSAAKSTWHKRLAMKRGATAALSSNASTGDAATPAKLARAEATASPSVLATNSSSAATSLFGYISALLVEHQSRLQQQQHQQMNGGQLPLGPLIALNQLLAQNSGTSTPSNV